MAGRETPVAVTHLASPAHHCMVADRVAIADDCCPRVLGPHNCALQHGYKRAAVSWSASLLPGTE